MSDTTPSRAHAADCPDPDMVGASIGFCPSTGEMTLRFVGRRCEGLPPWSLELVAFASGARSVRIDLTEIELADPRRTVDVLRTVLLHEHGVQRVSFDITPSETSPRAMR